MNKVIKVILPFLVVLLGVGAAVLLVRTKPQTARRKIAAKPTLVESTVVQPERRQVKVSAMGSVIAARSLELKAEVAGRVSSINKNLVPGGRIKKGQLLLRIDPKEYRLAVEQQAAAVEAAEVSLAMERGRRRIAEREWKLIGAKTEGSDDGRNLALRKPQLKSAQAALGGARSGLQRAELNVQRTIIKAPFNAFVKEEQVEVGQLVTPASNLGTLVGTDEFWVQVSIPVNRLPWFKTPGVNGDEGAEVIVTQDLGEGTQITRTGTVLRLMGDLDPQGRMARLVIMVNDPLGLEKSEKGEAPGVPMLLGAYVQVDIEGNELDGVFVLPRASLREGDKVWLVDANKKLRIQSVKVVWRGRSEVYVREGLSAGARVVTSRLATPVEGMRLRLDGEPDADEVARGKRKS